MNQMILIIWAPYLVYCLFLVSSCLCGLTSSDDRLWYYATRGFFLASLIYIIFCTTMGVFLCCNIEWTFVGGSNNGL